MSALSKFTRHLLFHIFRISLRTPCFNSDIGLCGVLQDDHKLRKGKTIIVKVEIFGSASSFFCILCIQVLRVVMHHNCKLSLHKHALSILSVRYCSLTSERTDSPVRSVCCRQSWLSITTSRCSSLQLSAYCLTYTRPRKPKQCCFL